MSNNELNSVTGIIFIVLILIAKNRELKLNI